MSTVAVGVQDVLIPVTEVPVPDSTVTSFDFIEDEPEPVPEPQPEPAAPEQQGAGIAGEPDNGVVEPESAEPAEEAAPETPVQQAHLPAPLDHLRIAHIIQIQSSDQFLQMFADFENQVETTIQPLLALLNKVIMTQEVQQIEQHAAQVDAWRNRITRFCGLAQAFVEHGKSSRLMMQKGKGVTDFDREAWKKTLTAAYVGFSRRLEGLVEDIDSRVNLCKKNSDTSKAGFRNFSGRIPQ